LHTLLQFLAQSSAFLAIHGMQQMAAEDEVSLPLGAAVA